MSGLVPHVTSLEEVYSVEADGKVSSQHTSRFANLVQIFKKTYGHAPDAVARSPGRVNIIGEHVDYSLYNVLPTAVTVDALVAFRKLDTASSDKITITVSNTNSTKYPSKTIEVPSSGEVEINKESHEWSNYFKAGLSGSLEFLRKEHGASFKPRSMEVLIDGNVPAGGGLSSSAAFVCAAALSVMEAHDHKITKQDLLDLCIVSERHVGVFSGGMDQAASIFSERGYLLYCKFFPQFSAEHVKVPKSESEFTYLIAQSFVTSEKAVTAPRQYNLRVVECTLATVVLAKLHELTLDPDFSPLGFCLRNFEEEYSRRSGHLDADPSSRLEKLISLIDSTLTQEQGYTRSEMASLLSISEPTLSETYMSKFPVEADHFKLRQRALHVATEALRVLQYRDTLSSASSSSSGSAGIISTTQLSFLGTLMNETQSSCRELYECSAPEIDLICSIARRHGALGSRLTGAGWGGCTVHLVPQDKVDEVTEALRSEYYVGHLGKELDMATDAGKEFMKSAVVVSKPGQGSQVIGGAALDV